nr:leucine aminopeptidase 1-like [Tanacetum cinerariifolium]
MLAVGVTEEDMAKDGASKFQNSILKRLDSQFGDLFFQVCIEEDFTGKSGQSTVLRLSAPGPKRVSLFGLGKCTSGSSTSAYRCLGESVSSAAKAYQVNNVAVILTTSEGLTPELKLTTASAIATGILLGTYEDNRYKSESKKPTLKSVDIVCLGAGPELEKKLKYIEHVCTGVILGRELVNSPANALTPAQEAEKIASTYSDVFSVKILDTEQCKELKMGSYLGVAAASANPPKFIHLCYKPTSCLIELMKFDMGGSAAVLGAAKALGQIKPAGVEVHFIVSACENMISGTGMRPGDIVTASNGKTIEATMTINGFEKSGSGGGPSSGFGISPVTWVSAQYSPPNHNRCDVGRSIFPSVASTFTAMIFIMSMLIHAFGYTTIQAFTANSFNA